MNLLLECSYIILNYYNFPSFQMKKHRKVKKLPLGYVRLLEQRTKLKIYP